MSKARLRGIESEKNDNSQLCKINFMSYGHARPRILSRLKLLESAKIIKGVLSTRVTVPCKCDTESSHGLLTTYRQAIARCVLKEKAQLGPHSQMVLLFYRIRPLSHS